jgi:two-component system NtrC family sensor kinase
MVIAENRDFVHLDAFVPLISALAAGALATAIVAREPGRRGNLLAGSMLLCAGWWAFFQSLWNLAGDPLTAERMMRLSNVGAMALSPLALHTLVAFRPSRAPRYRGLLAGSYLAAFGCILVTTTSNLVVAGALPLHPGWAPVVGPATEWIYGVLAVGPLLVCADSGLRHLRSPTHEERNISWAQVSVLVPFSLASATEFVLPLLGIRAPRLGATGLILWGGLVWWKVYRFRVPILSPQRFGREILALLPNGVMLVRLDGHVRMANAALGRLVGCRPEDLVGRRVDSLIESDAAPEPHEADESECQLVATEGRRVPVSLSRAVLRDNDGAAIGSVLMLRDLREIASLRSRLVTSGRLAAVGQLAAGIAHEINNPIAYVRSNIGLLRRHWEAASAALAKTDQAQEVEPALVDGHELLSESADGVDRIAAIVHDVGGFADRNAGERELVDLNELLDTAVRVATPQLRHRAEIVRSYQTLPLVRCVPQEVIQVFLNLVLNAAQSIEEHGTIRLTTRPLDTPREGEGVEVQVEDDGRGLDPDALERIFDPFFTTKPVGEGTGLGLAISQQIVSKHEGRIEGRPLPAGGARFGVWLPAGDDVERRGDDPERRGGDRGESGDPAA